MSQRRSNASLFRQRVLVQAVAAACLSLSVTAAQAIILTSSCTGLGGAQTISVTDTDTCNLASGDSLTIDPSGSIGTVGLPVADYGVRATSGVSVGAITNNLGSIHVSNADSNAVGIAFSQSASGSGITNSGTISAVTTGLGYAYGIRLWTSNAISGAILNSASGVISASATGNGSAFGIYLSSSSSIGNLTNNGTISATATTGQAAGIYLNGGSSIGSISNSGTIAGVSTSGDGYGIAASASSAINGGITNAAGGVIRGSTNSLLLQNGGGAFVVDNSGTLDGAVYLGINTLNLNGSSARVIGDTTDGGNGGTVNVNGTFTAEGNFAVDNFNIVSTGIFNAGNSTLTITNGVANSGVFAVGAGNTATINGDYTQAGTGTFRTGVTNDITYGKLVVNGTATLPTNARIDVNVANPGFSFTTARMANVISATTLVSDGSFSVTDNSLLFNFGAVKNGNAVDLTLSAAAPAVLASVNNQGNTPATGAATVLDGVIASDPNGALASHFVGLTNQQQVSNAVSQTLPLLTGGSTAATQSALFGIHRAIQARIDGNRGLSSGDDFLGNKSVWLKPFGSWAKQDDRNGVAGFKANTYGLILGTDGTLSPALRVGGAFAYANIDVNGQSSVAPQSSKVDVYQLAAYGSYDLDDRTAIDVQADAGQNTNQGRRQIAFASSIASSNYTSDTAHLGVALGRTYALSGQTRLTPSIRADYTWIRDKSYAESGAGALNLNVNSRTTDALVIGFDGKLAHQLNDQTTLVADLGIGYDTLSKQASMTSAFAGAPNAAFVTFGINPSPWLGRAGAGAVYKTKGGVEITARYDAEYRESFLNQTASVKARWAF